MTQPQDEVQSLTENVRELLSRNEIANQIYRYCFYFDSSDIDGLQSLFTEDAVVDYGPEMGPLSGIGEIMVSITKGLKNTFTATSHHISNVMVEFDGATSAHSQCYVYAWHKYQAKEEIGYLWGQYSHEFRLIGGVWKIARLKLRAVAIQDFHRSTMHPVERFSLDI